MKNEIYTGETPVEELLLIAGRINALANYIKTADFIDGKTVAAIIGVELDETETE